MCRFIVANAIAIAVLATQSLVAVAQTPPGCGFDAGTGTLTGVDITEGRVRVWRDGTDLVCSAGMSSPGGWRGPASSVTSVVLESSDMALIGLANVADSSAASYAGMTFSLSARLIYLQGQGAGGRLQVSVSDSSIAFGGATGTVVAATSLAFEGGTRSDTFDATGLTRFPVTVLGWRGSDVLTGSSLADSLDGGSGADTVNGGGGGDRLVGGPSLDLIHGGAGNDRLAGNLGDDTLIGDGGTDRAFGGDGTDTCDAETEDRCEI